LLKAERCWLLLFAGGVSEFFGKAVSRMPHHYIIVGILIDGLFAVPAESDFRHIETPRFSH
jgi:hypothetical protein